MQDKKILKILYKEFGRLRAVKVYATSIDKTDNFLIKAKIFSKISELDGKHFEVRKSAVEQIKDWNEGGGRK